MNQRSKRSSKGKGQNLGFTSVNVGGSIVNGGRDQKPEVQRATGDVKSDDLKGLAKASPLFKEIKTEKEEKTAKEKDKAVAKFTKKVDKKADEKK